MVRIVLALLLFFSTTCFTASPAYSADKKAKQTTPADKPKDGKPTLILLPVSGKGVEGDDLNFFRTTVAQGLGKNYTVKYGEQTDNIIKQIFDEHSRESLDCDESKCYRDIATALHADLIGKASVVKNGRDYNLSIEVYNVYENKSEYAKTDVCEGCNSKALKEALTALSAVTSAPSASLGFVSAGAAVSGGEAKVEMVTPQVSGDSDSTVAMLFITSEPTGAQVLLNNTKAGVTPFQNMEMSPGQELTVTLKKEMHHDKTMVFQLRPGKNKLGPIKMSPAFGTLVVESVPSGADVLIGGSNVGTTPLRMEKVESGRQLLTVKKPKYTSAANQTVEIKDGEETRVKYSLSPNFGTLKVTSMPSNADVVVYNTENTAIAKGQTPFNGELDPGSYRLMVSKTGHAPAEFKVGVAVGKTTEIDEKTAVLRRLEGRVVVSSEPFDESAEVYVDGNKEGNVPAELKLSAGFHDIVVKLGKREGKERFSVEDGKTKSLKLGLKETAPKIVKDVVPKTGFTDNNDGTVTDNKTGLMWQKDDDGQKREWDDSINYCRGLSLGGQRGWRLPDKDELVSLWNNAGSKQNIRDTYFPGMKRSYYWSSTSYALNTPTRGTSTLAVAASTATVRQTRTTLVACVSDSKLTLRLFDSLVFWYLARF
ncbi:MAG: PEGA domain-containing protein [Proteobacteria bacterium]|nr:PEGA domain-containing protein [Pseudomonadota bacterium]